MAVIYVPVITIVYVVLLYSVFEYFHEKAPSKGDRITKPAVYLCVVILFIGALSVVQFSRSLSGQKSNRPQSERIAFQNEVQEFMKANKWPNVRNFVGWKIGAGSVIEMKDDPRGGTYLATSRGSEGFSPDTLTKGYAFQPNKKGTPFGNARLKLEKIEGEWYKFSVSNDW